jgi:hypothetical protein
MREPERELLRHAIDPRHLTRLAGRWAKWRPGDVSTFDAAFEAYLSDPRCRQVSPNPLLDEPWYRQRHRDVDRAIRDGSVRSGLEHFVRTGVLEGRPFNPAIERRMAWCSRPAPPLDAAAGTGDPSVLDDESRTFLGYFPHVAPVDYFNRYGRFLGGTSPRAGSAPSATGSRTAILVLGMHRSGTSSLSASLVAAGAYIGSDLIAPTADNPKGHWESWEIARTHDAILARAGSSWDDPRAVEFPDAKGREAAVGELRDLVARKFPRSPLFAIKDPRACRLASLWRETLESAGVSITVLIPLRHPSEVAASLAARNGFPMEMGLRLWARHVVDAVRLTRGLPRTFVRYEDLLARGPDELERIGAALGIHWPVDAAERAARLRGFLEPGLRRQRTVEPAGNSSVDELWSLVQEGPAALDRTEAIEALHERVSADPSP